MILNAAAILSEAEKYAQEIPEDFDAGAAADRAAKAALSLLRDPADAEDERLPYLGACIMRYLVARWTDGEEYLKVGDVTLRGKSEYAAAKAALAGALRYCSDIIKDGGFYFC